jgi:hypothetical protein
MNNNRQTLIEKLRLTANAFRLGKEGQACESFRECIDLLAPMMSQLPAAELTTYMSAILAAQERHDWLAVADGLEYELILLLSKPA